MNLFKTFPVTIRVDQYSDRLYVELLTSQMRRLILRKINQAGLTRIAHIKWIGEERLDEGGSPVVYILRLTAEVYEYEGKNI